MNLRFDFVGYLYEFVVEFSNKWDTSMSLWLNSLIVGYLYEFVVEFSNKHSNNLATRGS